jgi:hypothetical protein
MFLNWDNLHTQVAIFAVLAQENALSFGINIPETHIFFDIYAQAPYLMQSSISEYVFNFTISPFERFTNCLSFMPVHLCFIPPWRSIFFDGFIAEAKLDYFCRVPNYYSKCGTSFVTTLPAPITTPSPIF